MADLDLGTVNKTPQELSALYEQIEGGEDIAPEAASTDAPAAAATEAEAGTVAPETAAEENAAGIATKDGKHVIPYSVLKGERDRAANAEKVAKDAQDRIAALEAQIAAKNGANNGEPAPAKLGAPPEADLSDEDLELLKEDFPTVYKREMALRARFDALEARLAPVVETVTSSRAERAQEATNEVQDAIDATPRLAHLQANDREAFDLAKEFDALLRVQPAWADKPLSDRFAKVADMVEEARGPIVVAGAKPQPVDLKVAAKAVADAAVKKAAANVPTSLSEFPAGQHAAQDEAEAAENMTPMQLAEKFGRMTPDQMDAYFSTL